MNQTRISPVQIVRAARYLVGTPYVHLGRKPGREGAIDCVGVLTCAGHAVGARVRDELVYPRETDGGMLRLCLEASCDQIEAHLISPGDIACFKRGRQIWHCGIVTEMRPRKMMVHAWSRYTASRVREEEMTDEWERAIHGVWRYREE